METDHERIWRFDQNIKIDCQIQSYIQFSLTYFCVDTRIFLLEKKKRSQGREGVVDGGQAEDIAFVLCYIAKEQENFWFKEKKNLIHEIRLSFTYLWSTHCTSPTHALCIGQVSVYEQNQI